VKRIIALILMLMLACCGALAQTEDIQITPEQDAIVRQAIEALKDHWTQDYQKNQPDVNGYLEIKNTRIFAIQDEPTGGALEAADKYALADFGEVEYIVEFMLLSDYFGTGPAYYVNACVNDHVIFYTDGTVKVSSNILNHFRAKTFSNDFSGIIEEVQDLGGAYNATYRLLNNPLGFLNGIFSSISG